MTLKYVKTPVEDCLMRLLPADKLNVQIAALRGWTKLVLVEHNGVFDTHYIEGVHPEGEGFVELVPNWATNLNDAIQLAIKYNLMLEFTDVEVTVNAPDEPIVFGRYSLYKSRSDATAMAISVAVAKHLEGKKSRGEI